MALRLFLVLFLLIGCCGTACAGAERWVKFAQDRDLDYFLDEQSVVPLPDGVFIFWMKSVAKEKEYFKKEYNVNDVAYQLTNYEVDCALSSYRVRGTLMLDKGRREVSKSLPSAAPPFEPVPPESVLELAQEEICARHQAAPKQAQKVDKEDKEDEETAAPAAPATAAAEPPSVQ